MKMFRKTLILLGGFLFAGAALAAPPVVDYPELNYVNVTNALIRLDRFKPDNQELLDAYSMVAHCDVVKGSFRDEFRWNQAREAMRKWIAVKKNTLPTRLSVHSRIAFDRYDFASHYFLFSPNTKIDRLNTFSSETRPSDKACDMPVTQQLPSRYQIVTNNPVSLPGLMLTQEQARDLAQKFNLQNNSNRIAYIRFTLDILDSDYVGPSEFTRGAKANQVLKVKASLHAVEFFSDPEYKARFYYYVPL